MVSTRPESHAFAGELANETCCRAMDVGEQQATKDGGRKVHTSRLEREAGSSARLLYESLFGGCKMFIG